MKPSVLAAIAVAIIVAIGGIFYFVSAEQEPEAVDSNSQPNTVDEIMPTQTDENEQQITQYTLSEVATHNSEDDCWTVIDGSVYDITSYIPRHPGGDEILRACGSDGSSLFNQRQTESGEDVGSGTPHSSNAKSQLERLKIGQLAN